MPRTSLGHFRSFEQRAEIFRNQTFEPMSRWPTRRNTGH